MPANGSLQAWSSTRPSVAVVAIGGYPIAGVSIDFMVTSGNGTFGGTHVTASVATDANGVASLPVDWAPAPPTPSPSASA